MTTLYFDAAEEDDLRKCGFSKDGKHSCPQIFLGLLVASGGNPIGYEIYEGNISEGHTMIPLIRKLASCFGFDKPIVVADAGLLSKANIDELTKAGGARLGQLTPEGMGVPTRKTGHLHQGYYHRTAGLHRPRGGHIGLRRGADKLTTPAYEKENFQNLASKKRHVPVPTATWPTDCRETFRAMWLASLSKSGAVVLVKIIHKKHHIRHSTIWSADTQFPTPFWLFSPLCRHAFCDRKCSFSEHPRCFAPWWLLRYGTI